MDKETDRPRNSVMQYHFKLFIAGNEANSRMALENFKRFCETHLKRNYTLEVVDVIKDYQSALQNNILLAPTLIIQSPFTEIKIVGSLNDEQKILKVLGLSGDEEGV